MIRQSIGRKRFRKIRKRICTFKTRFFAEKFPDRLVHPVESFKQLLVLQFQIIDLRVKSGNRLSIAVCTVCGQNPVGDGRIVGQDFLNQKGISRLKAEIDKIRVWQVETVQFPETIRTDFVLFKMKISVLSAFWTIIDSQFPHDFTSSQQ